MLKVLWFVAILHVLHVFCLRGYKDSRGQHSAGFILPSKASSAQKKTQNRMIELSADSVSSSHEPLPYSSGYVPQIQPGDLKYMGQPIQGEFKPANNFVLIMKNEMRNYSEAGVYLGNNSNKEFAGRVLAVGPGKRADSTGALIPTTVKVGDIVLYDPPEEKSVITYKKTECVLVPEDSIYARVESDFSEPRPLDSSNIKPLSDRILVRIIDSPKKTQSGLVISRSDDEMGMIFRASVISTGPGAHREDGTFVPNTEFREGDTILFLDTAADGGDFTLSRVQHAFVRPRAILAKL